DDQGVVRTLEEFHGRTLVLYAYPKDNTPGCTKEACSIRDRSQDLAGLGVTVVGVSPDSVASHAKFKQAHGLPFTLLSDPDKELLQKLGAWGEKTNYGRKYMGVIRSTFVIGPDGVVEKVWAKVTPATHGDQIAEYLKHRSKA
ncbi:MAG: peroxiredoxin, partial [Sphaerochaetaceae bacterium]